MLQIRIKLSLSKESKSDLQRQNVQETQDSRRPSLIYDSTDFQCQNVRETQDDSRPDIVPEVGDHLFELSWFEDVAATTKTFQILESNIAINPAAQMGNIECSQIELPGYHCDQVCRQEGQRRCRLF